MDGILIIHVMEYVYHLATSTSIMKRNQHVVSIFHPWNCFERLCMSASMRGMEKAPSGSGPCIYWRICGFLHHGGFRAAVCARGSAVVFDSSKNAELRGTLEG